MSAPDEDAALERFRTLLRIPTVSRNDVDLTGSGDQRLLWGRGTLDDKGALVAILEAVETLVAEGFAPAADVYLSFGHDEETVGSGAQAIAAALRGRGVRPALVLTRRGGGRADLPRRAPADRVVGVSEKGITSVRLTVEQHGGHASTPPQMTATVRLARAITRLNARPFPARLSETNLRMVETLGAHATVPLRVVFTRARRLQPLLRLVFARLSDETRAIVRTTTAVTQLHGSLAANALPERAEAVVNVRIAAPASRRR